MLFSLSSALLGWFFLSGPHLFAPRVALGRELVRAAWAGAWRYVVRAPSAGLLVPPALAGVAGVAFATYLAALLWRASRPVGDEGVVS